MERRAVKLVVALLLAFLVAVAHAEDNADPNQERINSIAFNSREVRVINGRPVEMKDDLGSRLLTVFDNFQKDVSYTADVIGERLDRGWTDFKRMVEDTTKKIG